MDDEKNENWLFGTTTTTTSTSNTSNTNWNQVFPQTAPLNVPYTGNPTTSVPWNIATSFPPMFQVAYLELMMYIIFEEDEMKKLVRFKQFLNNFPDIKQSFYDTYEKDPDSIPSMLKDVISFNKL